MAQNSIDDLSTYFADVVLNKMEMKSKGQLIAAQLRISAFEKTAVILKAVREAEEAGIVLMDSHMDAIQHAVDERFKFVAMDWDYEELHMKCFYAAIVPGSSPTNWVLVYQIQVEEVTMLFNCQVGKDGVFNYQLQLIYGQTDDLWAYYFDRTPCAFM